MTNNQSLSAEAIRMARKHLKNWSQVELAVRAGLSLATVHRAELGRASTRTVTAIAGALGVPVDELTGRKKLKLELSLVRLAGFAVAIALPVALARQMGPKKGAHRFMNAISDAYESGGAREFARLGELQLSVDGANFTVRADSLPVKDGPVECFVVHPEGTEDLTVYFVVEHHDFRRDNDQTAGGDE